MIRLIEIKKVFNAGRQNEYTALDGVSLTIDKGQIMVLKGPSGSGKTTLLSIIGCMSRPTAGRIWLGDLETTSLPERFLTGIRRSTYGFVFQQFNLIKGISAHENAILPGLPTGCGRRELDKKADRLFSMFDIADRASTPVEFLSGGEQQRVAIVRALINDPEVIIADEPTAHLDTKLSAEFIDIFSFLRQEGKTVIISSHDPVVCDAPIVDRVVSIRDGNIQ